MTLVADQVINYHATEYVLIISIINMIQSVLALLQMGAMSAATHIAPHKI